MIERFGLRAGLVAGALALGVTSVSQADISWVVFNVYAENEQGAGFLQLNLADGEYDPIAGTYFWSGGGMEIRDSFTNDVIATLDSGDISYFAGGGQGGTAGSMPGINLNFAVQAGFSDTTFTISSALIDLGGMENAQGRTSASVSVTDVDGNGASLTGAGADGGAFLSQYNGFVPSGTTFAEMLPSVAAAPFGSGTLSDEFPAGGAFAPMAGTVDNISSQFNFTLSALDLASGTSTYQVIPAPAGLAVLGGLGLLGRRRRRA